MEVSTKMRKLITLMLAAGALAVPAATAAPTKKPGGPKPCHGKARVMVVLKGTLANDPATGDTSFQLTVLRTNRWGRGYKQGTQPATINVTDTTRYVKADEASTLDALALNDRVVVKGKMSKCDLRGADPTNMPALTAKHVNDQTADAETGESS
jgi:hypothetical protein